MGNPSRVSRVPAESECLGVRVKGLLVVFDGKEPEKDPSDGNRCISFPVTK